MQVPIESVLEKRVVETHSIVSDEASWRNMHQLNASSELAYGTVRGSITFQEFGNARTRHNQCCGMW